MFVGILHRSGDAIDTGIDAAEIDLHFRGIAFLPYNAPSVHRPRISKVVLPRVGGLRLHAQRRLRSLLDLLSIQRALDADLIRLAPGPLRSLQVGRMR